MTGNFRQPQGATRLIGRATLGVTLALLALNATGCVNLRATVNGPARETVATGLQNGKGRKITVVMPFVDARTDTTRCGIKKTSRNSEAADIECSTPANVWLAQLMVDELKAAGFQVSTEAGGSAQGLSIAGTLHQFFVEPIMGFFSMSTETDIAIDLVATSSSGLVAERRFYVKGATTSFMESDSNLQVGSDAGVRAALHELVAAVGELADQFPTAASASVRIDPAAIASQEVSR